MAVTRKLPTVHIRAPEPRPDFLGEETERRLADSRAVGKELVVRVKGRDAQLRSRFVESRDPAAEGTPLVLVMRGGRGGEVRLKILLSLLWVAVQAPHDVDLPARVWAELIGLSGPRVSGARRVNAAFQWLVAAGFLSSERRPGEPTRLFLCEESLVGREYSIPGARIARLTQANENWDAHRYVKLPKAVWTNGWIAALPGPALAMLLVLLVHGAGRTEELWFSPGFADERYRLSEDTRQRGLHDLVLLGLVSVSRRPVSRSRLDVARLRNAYALNMEKLAEPPHMILGPRSARSAAVGETVAPYVARRQRLPRVTS